MLIAILRSKLVFHVFINEDSYDKLALILRIKKSKMAYYSIREENDDY